MSDKKRPITITSDIEEQTRAYLETTLMPANEKRALRDLPRRARERSRHGVGYLNVKIGDVFTTYRIGWGRSAPARRPHTVVPAA